ncbi:unnamed protein product [Rotaria socialis]
MCDHHLFIITVPNDWPTTINHNDNELNKNNFLNEIIDSETPLIDSAMPEFADSISPFLCQLLKDAILDKYDLNEASTWVLSADQKQYEVTFVSQIGTFCEELLHRLSEIGIGRLAGTRVAVLPLTYAIGSSTLTSYKIPKIPKTSLKSDLSYISKPSKTQAKIVGPDSLPSNGFQRRKSIRADFMQSIRSRLMVFQVVQAIRSQSSITFDFVVLVILASILAILGLLENSSVILVASMLISPLMGPILAIVFGLCIHDRSLLKTGLRSEFLGLFICVSCGFLMSLGTSTWETGWGSTTSFPTAEMTARGDLTRLSVGSMIALPSGAGVALSVLGGNAGSLVGVAISASLLPPAVNSGLLLGYSLLTAVFPNTFGRHSNETYNISRKIYPYHNMTCQAFALNDYRSLYSCNMSIETFILAISSFLLALVNILCIVLCGLIVLRIKEVAPSNTKNEKQISKTEQFFHNDIRRFRDYQKTLHNAQDLNDDNKSGRTSIFDNDDSTQREMHQQLLALAELHDLDMTNENDLTLNNFRARDKVKRLYKTVRQLDEDAKRLDIAIKDKRSLSALMMDVLPPKWTELFQHQQEQAIVEQHDPNENTQSHRSFHRHSPEYYKTYQTRLIDDRDHSVLPDNHRKHRKHLYSSDPCIMRSLSACEQESETQLLGTRFRLTKATIPLDDDEQAHKSTIQDDYV